MESDMAGHIRRRGKCSWELKWELPRDATTGKRETRTKNVRGTKKDAETALREILHSLDHGTYLEPSKITVGEFLVRWLEDVARPRVEASTYEFYFSMVRTRLIPGLGGIRLIDLHPMRIQQWYATLLESGRKDGRRQCSFFLRCFYSLALVKVFTTHCRRYYSSTFPITYSLTAYHIPFSFAGASDVLGNGIFLVKGPASSITLVDRCDISRSDKNKDDSLQCQTNSVLLRPSTTAQARSHRSFRRCATISATIAQSLIFAIS
jgi:hypothetical protein